MSVVIAIKKNDRIYMAADTMTSCGDVKTTYHVKDHRKIRQLDNGILIGHSGPVRNSQILFAHPEYFKLPEDGVLTKKYIVYNILPKIFKCYHENDMLKIEKNKPAKMPDSYIIAYKDKMFLLNDVFDVTAIDHFVGIGSGSNFTTVGLSLLDEKEISDDREINEALTEILRISVSRCRSVGAPFYLIDTATQEFTLAE